jgi:hypothetical protein
MSNLASLISLVCGAIFIFIHSMTLQPDFTLIEGLLWFILGGLWTINGNLDIIREKLRKEK